ncbi:hypothetical protein [Enteractinococcus helveticum]|uniref:hypothetical protein n=1 Tax=Enteractinococcus helveticum TaxID=1837282 RepID=UPI0005C2B1C6|nr:hypothetical protein [Enteractinococcus helveticum]
MTPNLHPLDHQQKAPDMDNQNLYQNDDSGLFHDVRMILENEVINFLHKYGVSTHRSITTMREVLDHLESEER